MHFPLNPESKIAILAALSKQQSLLCRYNTWCPPLQSIFSRYRTITCWNFQTMQLQKSLFFKNTNSAVYLHMLYAIGYLQSLKSKIVITWDQVPLFIYPIKTVKQTKNTALIKTKAFAKQYSHPIKGSWLLTWFAIFNGFYYNKPENWSLLIYFPNR